MAAGFERAEAFNQAVVVSDVTDMQEKVSCVNQSLAQGNDDDECG